jgi:hypothetical protein
MKPRAASRLALLTVTAVVLSGTVAHGASRDVQASEATAFQARLRTVALGVSMDWPGRNLGKLDAFRDSIGGPKVATWTIWSQWGWAETAPFPMAAAEGARDRGSVPFIWWEPLDPHDPTSTTYSRLRNVTEGLHDRYIRQFATDAKRFGGRVLLRFAPQANSDYLPWAWDYSQDDDNTIDTFKAAWRHVWRIFRDVGARNVKFVWTVATQTCKADCLTSPMGYPGDSYVDYMGFTWENWGDAPAGSDVPSQPWVSMRDGFKPVVKRLAGISGKPIMAAAVASGPDGGDKAAWIREGYRAVYAELPRIVAIMYLNIDLSPHPNRDRDWSLSGPSLAAYAEIAALPQFKGSIP